MSEKPKVLDWHKNAGYAIWERWGLSERMEDAIVIIASHDPHDKLRQMYQDCDEHRGRLMAEVARLTALVDELKEKAWKYDQLCK